MGHPSALLVVSPLRLRPDVMGIMHYDSVAEGGARVVHVVAQPPGRLEERGSSGR